MRADQFHLGIGVLAAWAFAVGIAGAADKKISRQDIPKPVMESVNARFPGADVTSVEKETEDGNVVYDFELKHEGRKYESDVKENGTIMEIEKEVAAKDAPPALAHTIKARYPDAAIKEIMEVNKVTGKREKPIHYEVTISTGGKHKEVIVSLDGKTVREEAEERPADGK